MKWWGKHVQVCLDILDKSTPKQWLLPPEKLPHEDQPHVVDFPRRSGALTAEEVVITDADVAVLLAAYQCGQWTVRQVVTAFLKKAVVMNQLVCVYPWTWPALLNLQRFCANGFGLLTIRL